MKKITYSLIMLFLIPSMMTMMAANVGPDDARKIVQRFTAQQVSQGKLRANNITWSLDHIKRSTVNADAADFYIFNATDNSTFVIIAGDDRAHNVLAYGNGPFSYDDLPDNMRWWLDHYAEQIDYLFTHPDLSIKRSGTPSIVIPQLLSTQWGQRAPYRDRCPMIGGKPCVTGCVATSMAQVMNYWKFPSVLPSLPSYYSYGLSQYVPALPETSVEWDLMQDTYKEGAYTQDQGNAVATLMRYCGQACKMDYTIASSSAWNHDQLLGLKSFGYSEQATYLMRNEFDDEEWNALILDDLIEHRPVIYSGKGGSLIHNFIIDGYDGSKYHVNWGWDGLNDGYYELDAMNGGSFKPTDDHQMLHGVYPDLSQEPQYNCDFVLDGICYRFTSDNTVGVCPKPTIPYTGNITIPDSVRFSGKDYAVTSIEDGAFSSCASLNSITLPSTIVTIGNQAFQGTALHDIVIPNSVTSIGSAAFSHCAKLRNITQSQSITTISESTFYNCTALRSLTVPSNVAHIGNNAFQNCTNLQNIILEPLSLSIGEKAFYNDPIIGIICHAETPPSASYNIFSDAVFQTASIIVPANSLELYNSTDPWSNFFSITPSWKNYKIDDYYFVQTSDQSVSLFQYTGNDEVVTIPTVINPDGQTLTVNAINCSAFYKNTSIKSIVIPNSVTSIGRYTFLGCVNLESVTLSSSITTIESSTFEECSNLSSINLPQSITFIGNAAFKKCKELTSIALPDSLESISDEAFSESGLSSIIIPPKVNNIGYQAFWYIYNLKKLSIECSGHFTLANEAFDKCYNIIDIQVKSKNPPAGNYNCFNIYAYQNATLCVPSSAIDLYQSIDPWSRFKKTISSDDALTSIDGLYFNKTGESTVSIFAYAGSSTSISIPETINYKNKIYTVTAIEDNVFSDCINLKDIVIPDVVTYIGNKAFRDCTKLANVSLSNSLTAINDETFMGCKSLTSINIPKAVTTIGTAAFKYCKYLSDVNFPDSLKTIGTAAFRNCFNLSTVNFPNSLTTIGSEAFHGTALTQVTIPKGVTIINNNTFEKCNALTAVNISNTVTTIGAAAFKGCNSIHTIVARSIVPPALDQAAFDQTTYDTAILNVPKDAIQEYKDNAQWRLFSSIIPINLHGDVNGDEEINIADVNLIIDAILSGQTDDTLDLNSDGEINIVDVNYLIDLF